MLSPLCGSWGHLITQTTQTRFLTVVWNHSSGMGPKRFIEFVDHCKVYSAYQWLIATLAQQFGLSVEPFKVKFNFSETRHSTNFSKRIEMINLRSRALRINRQTMEIQFGGFNFKIFISSRWNTFEKVFRYELDVCGLEIWIRKVAGFNQVDLFAFWLAAVAPFAE